MTANRIPPDALCSGRRRIEELPFCDLIEDLAWNDSVNKWILHCRITIPKGSQFISKESEWFVLVDAHYPFGVIAFYPAKENGIKATFQHQKYNGPGDNKFPWREGNICCSTPRGGLRRREYDSEPTTESDRLMWHFYRARDWLVNASKNQLINPGDIFELPHFPNRSAQQNNIVAFSEDVDSMHQWNRINENFGIAKLEKYEAVPHIFVKAFLSAKEEELYRPCFGNALSSKTKPSDECIWVKIRHLPILEPWQAPECWGELKEFFKKENIDLKDLLSPFLKRFRDGKQHFLLIGFPIPKTFGGELEQMHWQTLYMPPLSCGKVKGFRPVEKSYLSRDFTMVFDEKKPLNWHSSENWHSEQISTRGRYPESILKQSAALIGAGALGSMFGELLIRSGLKSLSIIDNDKLEIGNLVRHTLDITKIGYPKAEALAERLNLINPNSCVNSNSTFFSYEDESIKNILDHCQLIIDCTGNDFIVSQMEHFNWESDKIFVSISTGMFARRLFIYLAKGRNFDADDFKSAMKDWLNKEKDEFDDYEFPQEGIGCWHPVFPARADDLWLMASVASNFFVNAIDQKNVQKQLMVFEQQVENNQFLGVKRVQ